MHHTDPFDRLLIAQAMSEPMHLLTADAQLKPYSELVHPGIATCLPQTNARPHSCNAHIILYEMPAIILC